MTMVVFLLLILGIYYFSRSAIKEIFFFLRRFFPNDKFVLALITLILFPGTLVHELSHFLTAMFLLLPVKSMSLLPTFESHEIKLGEVRFEKRDSLRGAIVGIAPFFFGVALLYSFFYFGVFPGSSILYNVFMAYIIFSISSNMFSSPQDLKDTAIIIPISLLIGAIIYIFDIKLDMTLVNAIMKEANYYLFLVLAINVILFLLLRIINTTRR